MSEDTGLEKAAARTPAVITTPEEFRGALMRWQEQRYHVLSPFSNISGLAPSHGIITSLVQINTDKLVGEVYDGLPFLKADEVALSKNGLRKIAECAGISTRTERTDGRLIPHYWEIKAIATYRGVDGAVVTREATMEWDLRDGSDRLKGWTANQISEGRKHGLRACETRAINAAIRECGCGVKQKYTRKELEKPFVVIRVAFQPDMSDPETKRMVTERALGGTHALYAPTTSGRALPAADVDEDGPGDAGAARSVGSGSTRSTASASATETASEAKDDKPPTPNAVRIMKVEPKSGETNGRKWTVWTVVDSNGVEYSTFDTKIADAAKAFERSKAWVDVLDNQQGQYRNIEEIGPAQPSLLPDPASL